MEPKRCPICKAILAEPRFGSESSAPFCSDRCKLIDLGRWLDGKYQIAVAPEDEDEGAVDSAFPGAGEDETE